MPKVRSVIAVLLLVSVGYLSFGVWTYDPVDMNKVAQSVVILTDGQGHGSGVIVGPNCVLTAKHVAAYMPLVIKTLDGETFAVVKVVEDPDSDLAIVYIDGVFDEQPLLLDPTPLRVGESVTLIGTPMDLVLIDCILSGTVVKIDVDVVEMSQLNIDVFDAHGGPGTSGGPVVDSKGHIRGIQVIGIGMLSGAVPIGELNI